MKKVIFKNGLLGLILAFLFLFAETETVSAQVASSLTDVSAVNDVFSKPPTGTFLTPSEAMDVLNTEMLGIMTYMKTPGLPVIVRKSYERKFNYYDGIHGLLSEGKSVPVSITEALHNAGRPMPRPAISAYEDLKQEAVVLLSN